MPILIKIVSSCVLFFAIVASVHSQISTAEESASADILMAQAVTKPGIPQVEFLEEVPTRSVPELSVTEPSPELINSVSNDYSTIDNPLTQVYSDQFQRIQDASMGSWGSPAAPSGASEWLKVPINQGSFWGIALRNPMLPAETEGWISYWMRLTNWNNSEYSTKLPGPSAALTEGASSSQQFPTVAGGNGGGGAGGTSGGPTNKGKSWSARMTITPVKSQWTTKGELGYELYHRDSPAKGSDGRVFGETQRWRLNGVNSAQILDEKWYRIKHYVKLNDIGRSNGVLRGYLNGELAYERTDISFADNPEYRNIALFLNVYHGGTIPATDDFEFYIDGIRFNVGPIDLTQ